MSYGFTSEFVHNFLILLCCIINNDYLKGASEIGTTCHHYYHRQLEITKSCNPPASLTEVIGVYRLVLMVYTSVRYYKLLLVLYTL